MTTFTWKTAGASGAFETAANWTPSGGPPGGGDDALLTATGTYTVSTAASDAVNSLQTASGATLAIGANLSFTMNNGTESAAFPTGANAGQITVANNSSLFIGGTFNNTSTVAGGGVVLNGAANVDALRLTTATVVFTGGGAVTLGTSGNNVIYGNAFADVLDNKNNTFAGVGNIGDNQMTLTNEAAGVINANSATGALTVQVNNGVTNTGLLEATGVGGLNLLNDGIVNTGGTVKATGAGVDVNLQGATIYGGTLTTLTSGAINVQGGNSGSLVGTPTCGAVTISTGSNVTVQNNSSLYLYGTINNQGKISQLAGGNNTDIRLGSASAQTTVLTGGGQVVMGGSTNARLYSNAYNYVLDNVNNTISGYGQLGAGQMTLVNQTAGVVNASDATNALTVWVNGGITNDGLLEATGAGGLVLQSDGVDNEGAGNSGKVSAATSGSSVDLDGTTIYGGTVSAVSGAQIYVGAGQGGGLYGADPGLALTITAGTNVNQVNNSSLYLSGVIANGGAININAGGNNTDLRLQTPVTTLTGGGSVLLNGNNARIYGNGGYLDELDNVNNTISGIGQLGANQMTMVNEVAGVVNANQGGQLTVWVNGGIINKGLFEATNAAGNLYLQSDSIDNTQNSDSGKLSATVSGAHIDLAAGTIIYGGALTAVAGAYFDVVSGNQAYLDGTYSGAPVDISAGTNVDVTNNSSLNLRGTIVNNGVINVGVNAGGNGTYLRLNSPVVTLTSSTPTAAGGVIQLANTANNQIYGLDGYSEVLNNINNTIQGSGNIGSNQMTLINGKLGVIDANQPFGGAGSGEPGQLVIQVNGGVTNNGLIESSVPTGGTAGGDLLILNTTVNQTGGGKIQALGVTTNKVKYGSTVDLQGADIQGGSLISSNGYTTAVIETDSGTGSTLDGSVKAVTDSAIFNVENNSTLYLDGSIITKSGSINLQGAGNTTFLRIVGPTTLTGTGKITLSNSANNVIVANNVVQDLYNFDNTISGAGNIGDGTSLILTNETKGVINANQTTALAIQDNSTVENYGLIESATTTVGAGGLLILNTNIDNTISNGTALNTGKITATGTGHVDLQSSNIYGGTLTTTGTAVIDVVSGTGAGLNGTVLGQAVNIAAGSNIVANNNSSLYLYGAINNAGTITVAGAGNSTFIRLGSSDVTLSGGGNLVLSGGTGTDYIIQVASSALLDNVNNTISGGGNIGNGGNMSLTNESGGTIDATLPGGLAINLGGVSLNNAGVLEATGSNLSVSNAVVNTGVIKANGGNVTIGGNVDGAGAIQLYSSSNVEIGDSYGGASAQAVTFESGSTGTFKIDNAQNFTGTITGFNASNFIDLGNVNIGSAVISGYNAGTGVLTVTDGATVANITLVGTYVLGNFSLVNDGSGHTLIKDPPVAPASVNQMVSAMASMGGGAGSAGLSSLATPQAGSLALAMPHAA